MVASLSLSGSPSVSSSLAFSLSLSPLKPQTLILSLKRKRRLATFSEPETNSIVVRVNQSCIPFVLVLRFGLLNCPLEAQSLGLVITFF